MTFDHCTEWWTVHYFIISFARWRYFTILTNNPERSSCILFARCRKFRSVALSWFQWKAVGCLGQFNFCVCHSRWNRWNKKLTRSSSSEFFLDLPCSESDTYIDERFEACVHKIRHEYIFLYNKFIAISARFYYRDKQKYRWIRDKQLYSLWGRFWFVFFFGSSHFSWEFSPDCSSFPPTFAYYLAVICVEAWDEILASTASRVRTASHALRLFWRTIEDWEWGILWLWTSEDPRTPPTSRGHGGAYHRYHVTTLFRLSCSSYFCQAIDGTGPMRYNGCKYLDTPLYYRAYIFCGLVRFICIFRHNICIFSRVLCTVADPGGPQGAMPPPQTMDKLFFHT